MLVAARLEAGVEDVMLEGAGWWTEGSPLVQPRRYDIAALLPESAAGAMLRDPDFAEQV